MPPTVAPLTTRLAAALLSLAVVAGLALNGAHLPSVQAGVLLLCATALAVLAGAPPAHLARHGGGAALALPLAIAAGIAALGAIPWPEAALRWIAPGRVLGDGAAASANAGIAASLDGIGPWLLAAAALVGVVVIGPRRELAVERIAAWALLGLGAIVAAHRLALPPRPYGLLPVATASYGGWAPMINQNFNATVALALLPLAALGALRSPDPERPATWLLAAGSVAGIGVVVATGSSGAMGALLLVAAMAGLRAVLGDRHWLRRAASVGLVAVAIPVGLVAERTLGQDASVGLRLDQWARTLDLARTHWLFGVGPGGYGDSYPAFQNRYRPSRFDHAHSDPLEWAVEVGALGLLVVAAALLLWRMRPRAWGSRATALELGLLAATLHAAVDFPLHLPAIAMLAAGLLGWRLAAYEPHPTWPVPASRAALAALSLACLLTAGWQGARAWTDAALARATAGSDEAALASLARWAPWRAGPVAARARLLATDPARADEARALALQLAADFPRDASAQWQAGATLARLRAVAEATPILERAADLHAADARPPALLSRIAESRGDREAAIAWWRRALQSYPYDAAVRDRPFDRALDLQPAGVWWVDALDDGAEPYLLVQLALSLNRRDDPLSAWLALQEAVRRDPTLDTLPELGRTLTRLGRLDEAIDQLAKSAQIYPAVALRYRAEALRAAGRFGEARSDARAALFHDPDRVEAALLLLAAARDDEGPTAVIDEADALHEGAARHHPRVARAVADAAHAAYRWPECVRWLSAIEDRSQADQARLTACQERCVACPIGPR